MNKYEMLKLDNQVCFPLYAASRQVIRHYRPYLDALDLTYTQYITLLVLWEEKELCVKDLGQRLFLDSGTLTPVLKSLESKGCVKRERSLKDERMMKVSVTQKGMQLREKATEVPAKAGACMKLKPGEGKQLYSLLYKVLDGFSAEE